MVGRWLVRKWVVGGWLIKKDSGGGFDVNGGLEEKEGRQATAYGETITRSFCFYLFPAKYIDSNRNGRSNLKMRSSFLPIS